jgi:serine/threonine protein kinase
MDTKHHSAGTVIADRFRVVSHIGDGAVGEVYLVEHTALGRQYALKLLKKKFKRNEVMTERFRREALAASRLEHPNIVYISDFGRTLAGDLYLAMEYIQGMSLATVINNALPGVIPLRRALHIVWQISRAVATAHDAGVLHRDLKPENVMLSQGRVGADAVKILDFGLAKITVEADQNVLTQKGMMFGTPAYMSPEQARGEPLDTRTDIYALGAITYELLTGRPPFYTTSLGNLLLAKQTAQAPPPSENRPRGFEPLDEEIDRLVLQCLEKDPERRPLRASRIAAKLAECLHKAQPATPSSVTTLEYDKVDAEDLEAVVPDPVPDSLTETHPQSASGRGATGGEISFVEIAPFRWKLVVATARETANLLKKHGLAGEETRRLLESIEHHDERILGLKARLAVPLSTLGEKEAAHREKTAQLRHALIDLRLEHNRLRDTDDPDETRLSALSAQIQQLEHRLAQVYKQNRRELAEPERQVAALEKEIESLQHRQMEAEVDLLQILRQPPTDQQPIAEITSAYEKLENLLEGSS